MGIELWSEGVEDKDIITKGQNPLNYQVNYPSGLLVNTAVVSNALGTLNHITNAYWFFPFIPIANFRLSNLFVSITTASAGAAVLVYLFETDPTTGLPLGQIFHTQLIGTDTTGVKTVTTADFNTPSGFEQNIALDTFVFEQNKWYWIGYFSTGAGAVRANNVNNTAPLGLVSAGIATHATHYRATAVLNPELDDPMLLSPTLTGGSLPCVNFTTTSV
jgi:hypothetical protein